MCCGKYKHELFRQDTVNQALIKVHNQVMHKIKQVDKEKKEKKKKKKGEQEVDKKTAAQRELYKALKEQEFIIKLRQALIITTNNTIINYRTKIEGDPNHDLHNNSISKNFKNLHPIRDDGSVSENQSDVESQQIGQGIRQQTGGNFLVKDGQELIFGKYYVGYPFKLDDIESTISWY